MFLIKKIFSVSILIFLFSCAVSNNYPTGESEFYSALEDNYRTYSDYKKINYGWKPARIFEKKANNIRAGNIVLPETRFQGMDLKIYNTNLRYVELVDFYERMHLIFNVPDAKKNYPKELADMQFYYDCWVIEESLHERYSQISRCKDNFIETLGFLENSLIIIDDDQKKYFDDTLDNKDTFKDIYIKKKYYIVYFDFDSSVITEDAAISIKKFIDSYNSIIDKENYVINISGHADRVGNKNYNQKLSKRRSDTVRHYLIKNGIDEDSIKIRNMGEIDPRVITQDNAKEDTNRRVVITIDEII